MGPNGVQWQQSEKVMGNNVGLYHLRGWRVQVRGETLVADMTAAISLRRILLLFVSAGHPGPQRRYQGEMIPSVATLLSRDRKGLTTGLTVQ